MHCSPLFTLTFGRILVEHGLQVEELHRLTLAPPEITCPHQSFPHTEETLLLPLAEGLLWLPQDGEPLFAVLPHEELLLPLPNEEVDAEEVDADEVEPSLRFPHTCSMVDIFGWICVIG